MTIKHPKNSRDVPGAAYYLGTLVRNFFKCRRSGVLLAKTAIVLLFVCLLLVFRLTRIGCLECAQTRVVISYVVNTPEFQSYLDRSQCLSNLRKFVELGVARSRRVSFVFSFVGNASANIAELDSVRDYPNVFIQRKIATTADWEIHTVLLETALGNQRVRFFFCLSCYVRGPYQNPNTRAKLTAPPLKYLVHRNLLWTNRFISRLNATTKVVVPSGRIVTNAVVFDRVGAEFALDLWNANLPEFFSSRRNQFGVRLRENIISGGYQIESLSANVDNKWESSHSNIPLPCDSVFVLYEGISSTTLDFVAIEDREQCGKIQHLQPRFSHDYNPNTHGSKRRSIIFSKDNAVYILRIHSVIHVHLS